MKIVDINSQIKAKHVEIISLCFDLCEKGIHCFYNYSPHVDWSEVRIYENGWAFNDSKHPDETLGFLWSALPRDLTDEDITNDKSTVDATFEKLDKCIERLKSLNESV